MELNKQFWNQRYLDSNTGWDVGYITTPIKEYIDQIQNKEIKVLVPGSEMVTKQNIYISWALKIFLYLIMQIEH